MSLTYSVGSPKESAKLLGELMLYIAQQSEDDAFFGAVKLNKILWYSDFEAFGHLGEPITGSEYQPISLGPAPVQLLPVRRSLVLDGHARVEEVEIAGRQQNRLVALRDPNLFLFTVDQIKIVDGVIDRLRLMSGTQTSELSHGRAWRAAKETHELIPYEAAFLSDEDLTEEDRAWAQRAVARFKSS